MVWCGASPVWSCPSRRYPSGILLVPTGGKQSLESPLKENESCRAGYLPLQYHVCERFLSESYFVEKINFLLTSGGLRKCPKSLLWGCYWNWWCYTGFVQHDEVWLLNTGLAVWLGCLWSCIQRQGGLLLCWGGVACWEEWGLVKLVTVCAHPSATGFAKKVRDFEPGPRLQGELVWGRHLEGACRARSPPSWYLLWECSVWPFLKCQMQLSLTIIQ